MAEPGTPRLLRAINDRAVLDLLLADGPLSRPALGDLTGLSKPTVSQVLSRLTAAGLVRPSGSSPGRPRPERGAVRDRTPSRPRRGPRRHPAPDPRGRRRHHRTDRRPRTSCRHPVGPQGTPWLWSPMRSTAPAGTPASTAPCCAGWWSAHRAPSTPARNGSATPATCPAGTIPACSTGSATRWRCPSTSTTTSTSPRWPSSALGAARGSENFVLLWGEEGLGAAIVIGGRLHRGVHRRRRRGRLPAAARDPAGAQRRRQQRRRLPGAGRRQAGAGAGPRARHPRRATAEAAVATAPVTRRRRRVPGRRSAHRLALGLAAIVAVLDPELVILSGGVISAGGEPPARPRAPRAARPVTLPAPDGAHAAYRTTRSSTARCTRRSRPPATTSSTPTTRPPAPGPPSSDRPITGPTDTDWRIAMPLPNTNAHRSSWLPRPSLALAAGCGGSRQGSANDDPNADVTITFWHGWSAPSEVKAIQANVDAFEKRAPEHPRQGRRQHHRRQDQPGAAGRRRQRPRRRLVVHHRQRRRVLHLARLRRPRRRSSRSPASTPTTTFPKPHARLHPVRRRPVHAAAAQRRLRPLLQQGRLRRGRHHRAAQDAVGVRRRRGQADQDRRATRYSQLGFMPNYHGYESTIDALRRAVERRRTSTPTASPTSPTTRPSRRSFEWQKDLVDKLGGYDKLEKYRDDVRRRVRRQEPVHDRPGGDGASTASGGPA